MSWLEYEQDADKAYFGRSINSLVIFLGVLIVLSIFAVMFVKMADNMTSTGNLQEDLLGTGKLVLVCTGFLIMCMMIFIVPIARLQGDVDRIIDTLDVEVLKKKTIKYGLLHGAFRYYMKDKRSRK